MGYQEGNYYEKVMKEIAGHPDFGKRNPVDIGMECGYPEQDVLEMIQFLYDVKGKQQVDGGASERTNYYFLLKKSGAFYIVSVNINTWKTKIVRKVTERFVHFQIKGSIFAWTDGERRLFWEDLESWHKGEFLSGTYIKSILIVEEGILAASWDAVIRFHFDGAKETLYWVHTGDHSMMLEGRENIYIVTYGGNDNSHIWSVNKEKFKTVKHVFYDTSVSAVEYTEDGLCWYVGAGDRGIGYSATAGIMPNRTRNYTAYVVLRKSGCSRIMDAGKG